MVRGGRKRMAAAIRGIWESPGVKTLALYKA